MSNRPQQISGLSMPEVLVTVFVIGILSAIATPSFLTWLANRSVETVVTEVKGALREVQAEALRASRGCTVNIDTTTRVVSAQTTLPTPLPTPAPAPEGCLPTGIKQLDQNPQLQITSNFAPGTLNFTYRGTTPNGGIIVVRHTAGNKPQCIVLSEGIGIIRTGFFSGNPASPTPANCQRNL